MSTTAAEVRAEMARQGRTTIDVAQAAGIPRARLSSRLNERIPFNIEELAAVAEVLQVPTWEFLRRASKHDAA